MFRLAVLRQLSHRFPSVSAVLVLAGVMVLATVLATTVLLLELRQEELAHAKGEVATLTQVLSEQTARTFDGVSLMMRGIKERLSDDFGVRLELDSDPVRFLLQARSAGLPQVKSVFVLDDLGRGVNSSRPDSVPRFDASGRPFFRFFAEGGTEPIFISRPEKARIDGQWTFYVGMRLARPDGSFRGVLVAAINHGYFETLYEGVKLDFVSRIQLLDLDGELMAGKAFDNLARGEAPNREQGGQGGLRTLPPGRVVEEQEQSADGLRLVGYRRAGEYPLAIKVAVDEYEALTPWRRVMRPIVAGIVTMLLFVLGTTFLLVRNLMRRRMLEIESNSQLQSLSASLQNYREEERARIARELHDELGQLLTGIRMEVSWLGGRLQPDQRSLVDKVASVKGQIDQTIATVRRISSELRPLALDDLGFSAAASWYVDQFSARTGLPVELSLPDRDPELGDAVATALFRVLQESLTNVARHAQAGKVAVSLNCEDGAWTLRVEDDGVGFVPEAGKRDIGLVGMRERAQNLGGRFSVISAPGQGTRVEVVIPATGTQEDVPWKR